ncbi:hypothetical protein [Curtobacterium luteum]|uniref:Uncharacterized protein n=1 Tax=Curtobacterium luteum TaxID=33881 RepID=A0A175RRW3_9MICO|nr:hypothetical protein [Curtobacterium luteum]KTR06470.1 hypothetical protein NS184_08960 [Curtobacterium luteum]
MSHTTGHPAPLDHLPDAAAPRPRTSTPDRGRFAVLTAGTVVLATGIVLIVSEALPLLAGWVLPVVLTLLTVVFLVLGRRAAASGSTAAARAWAGWAGATATFGLFGLVNLVGLGGALVAVLLVAVAVNVGIALWFRSPVQFVVAQGLTLAWGVVAHVFGVVPVAVVVAGLVGSWWIRTVGAARSVVVATTVLLPVGVALVVHPLTHDGAAVDGADVAVLTGAVAVAVTAGSVVGRAPGVSTVWSTTRVTAVVVLVAQVVAGAVPVVASSLTSAAPWPSVLLAAAAVLGSAAVVVVARTRGGIVTVLVLCSLQLAELVLALAVGTAAASTAGLGGLLVLSVVTATRRRSVLAWVPVLVLPALWGAVVALPVLAVAGVLVVSGAVVATVLAPAGARR